MAADRLERNQSPSKLTRKEALAEVSRFVRGVLRRSSRKDHAAIAVRLEGIAAGILEREHRKNR